MFSEDPILLPEIVDQIVLVTVHPASEREDEELQRRRHSLRLLGRLDQHRPSLGRFFAPYAIERHEIVCPRIDVFYTEHLYCGEDDLFGSGHPPDTVVAMALAYHAFKAGRQPGDYGVTI